ncbi:Ig-like domain-containing protein [Mucilaginibacter koreensis]
MALNSKCLFFAKISVLFVVLLFIFSCASIQRPQGGPKDFAPPKLLQATPDNMTRNFKAQQITLEFDEYFKLANQYQEISISPAQEKQPEYKIKDKSLVINLRDSLLKNTTYVINFGKAIADNHEGNILKNFTYVFSTGPHIDSLSVSGSVSNTQTGEKEKDATVMLFPLDQDTAFFGKKKPYIFTTTDSAGNFSLNNLHDGDYRIYALKEATPDKVYNNDAELIAFLKRPIHLTGDTSNVQLKLFRQIPEKFRVVDKHVTPEGALFFSFNKSLVTPDVKVNYPPDFDRQKLVDFTKNRDTALVYMRNMDFDSISVSVVDQNKLLDTVYLRKGRKESFTRNLGFGYNINVDNHLKPNTDLQMTANIPIESFDQSRIQLTEDSAQVSGFTIQKDAANPKRLLLKYRWKQDVRYELTLLEDAFTDIYGDKNKRQLKRFTVDKPENYGTLTVKVTVPDSTKSYIVQLTDPKQNVYRSDIIKKNTSLVYKDYFATKYRVKVIYDNNGNGRWDSGNVKQKVYPESIWTDTKEITLRPNWEQEETVAIPKEIITP